MKNFIIIIFKAAEKATSNSNLIKHKYIKAMKSLIYSYRDKYNLMYCMGGMDMGWLIRGLITSNSYVVFKNETESEEPMRTNVDNQYVFLFSSLYPKTIKYILAKISSIKLHFYLNLNLFKQRISHFCIFQITFNMRVMVFFINVLNVKYSATKMERFCDISCLN